MRRRRFVWATWLLVALTGGCGSDDGDGGAAGASGEVPAAPAPGAATGGDPGAAPVGAGLPLAGAPAAGAPAPTEPLTGGAEAPPIEPETPPPTPAPGGPTMLPTPSGECPPMIAGVHNFAGMDVQLEVAGNARELGDGPLVFWWHGTGGRASSVSALGSMIPAVVGQGGLVASFASSSRTCTGCTTTGNDVWFYEDFAVADEVLACAIEQVGIDTRRIHATGMSAGGLQSAAMGYARSGYVASVAPLSGGLVVFAGFTVTDTTLQDPSNKFAAMLVHGGDGDIVVIEFKVGSEAMKADLEMRGHFAFLCDHAGGHRIPSGIMEPMWDFFQNHPWGTEPSPYAGGLPGVFPAYCGL